MQHQLDSFRLTDILVPLRSLSRGDRLLAGVVGRLRCWRSRRPPGSRSSVTYLVVALGQSLSTAGLVFAVMQTSSMFGRVILGWIADHVASGTMTLMIAALGLGRLDHPARLQHAGLAAVGVSCCSRPSRAFAVSGWNGVQIAEVARRSPPELIGETAAGGGHPDFHGQHADAGGLRGLRRDHRPLRSGLPGVRGLQPGLPAAALRHGAEQSRRPAR